MTEAESREDLDDFLGVQPQKPWRRWLKWGGILLAVLFALWLISRLFAGDPPPAFVTSPAVEGDLTVTVSATGNLKPVNQVDVGSEQSGLITAVYADVNDKVVRGQLLVQLDTSRLRDAVDQSRAQLMAAEAQVKQAQAQAALARATLDRQQEVFRLSDGRVPSKTELDGARSTNESAIATVRSAEAQVSVAKAQLGTSLTNLSKARIVSPVNGVVLSRDIEPGQTVAASFNAPVLFTIAEDLQQMEVDVSVDEADVGQVQDGQRASFTVDAFPGRTFPAFVRRVNVASSSAATAATTANTVVAYTAVLSVANSDETLRPGMTATADITTKQLNRVLMVPNAALRFRPASSAQSGGITSKLVMRPNRSGASREVAFGAGSSQTLYVLDAAGVPQPVQVVVGESDGTRTVIQSGDVTVGTRVVTAQLAPGQEAPPEQGDNGAPAPPARAGSKAPAGG